MLLFLFCAKKERTDRNEESNWMSLWPDDTWEKHIGIFEIENEYKEVSICTEKHMQHERFGVYTSIFAVQI